MKFLWTLLTLIGINIPSLSGQATIAGTIQKVNAETASLHFYPTILGEEAISLETTLNENGQFQFDINPTMAVPAVLQIANFNCLIFLFPEKSLQIDIQIDEQYQPLIIFDGIAAADNQFYLQYQNVLNQEKKNIPPKLLEKFKPKDYLVYQTKLKQRKIGYLHKNKFKIDERLFNWLENDVSYQFANDLFEYPNRELITQTPPKKYYHFLKEVQLNNEEAILQPSYQRFLLGYTNHQLFKPQKWGRYATAEKQFNFVRRYFFGEVLHYLQFFILKTSLKFDKEAEIEKAYREFLTSKAPQGFKRQLRQTHQLASHNILGQPFPKKLLKNQYGRYDKGELKAENAKLFYVWQTAVKAEKVAIIQALFNRITQKKYLDFGLVGLDETIEFPKVLSAIPKFWVTSFSLKSYREKIPIEEAGYLLFINKYGEVIEYITWEVDLESVNEIVDFMAENYKSRVYSTLTNRSIRQKKY